MPKKKAKRPPKKKPPSKRLSVAVEQWKLPVACDAGGAFVTLEEAAKTKVAALAFTELSPDLQAELVAKRIDMQPKFDVAMVGLGFVDKQRAVQEVRARTPAGKTLIEIEQRMIARMIDRASEGGD
jgi:hypothetical protein